MGKYSEVVKAKIRSEYKAGEFGYKRLAAKYGMKRDEVRGIIHASHKAEGTESMQEQETPRFNSVEEELEYYKTAAMYYEIYSRRLEVNMAEDLKKKAGLRQPLSAKGTVRG